MHAENSHPNDVLPKGSGYGYLTLLNRNIYVHFVDSFSGFIKGIFRGRA